VEEEENQHDRGSWSPEKTQAWTLALYPLVIIGLSIFMVLTEKKITTDVSGLFLGLLTAGTLHAAATKKKGESNADSNDSHPDDESVRKSGDPEVESRNRSWTDNLNRWRNGHFRVRRNQMGGLRASN